MWLQGFQTVEYIFFLQDTRFKTGFFETKILVGEVLTTHIMEIMEWRPRSKRKTLLGFFISLLFCFYFASS